MSEIECIGQTESRTSTKFSAAILSVLKPERHTCFII